ncbi:hypothetical protein [Azospirillum sp. SYSU D00513]|uniref:hypothetical protein n=1 Tax=Azospirillum sp. SYSU D00513 TaxID=2812561 RepID=UPI001A9581E0|nr:hypothetical protein [Azospirillum sp. SYSU D00513]
MAVFELTDVGEQFVLPGAERRTFPGLPYAIEPNGQLALHFYDPPPKPEPVAVAPSFLVHLRHEHQPTTTAEPGTRGAHFPDVTLEAAEAFRAFLSVGR